MILIANISDEIVVSGAEVRTTASESSNFTAVNFLTSRIVLELLQCGCFTKLLNPLLLYTGFIMCGDV